MSRFVNILIIIGMLLGSAHCAVAPEENAEGSTTFDTFEAEVFEEPSSPAQEAHEKHPGDLDPGKLGEEPGTKVNINEVQDEEIWVDEKSDQDFTVESYCGAARSECERGAEPIVRAVCKEKYEDCVAPSNCETQQTVCLLNQFAPDTCQRQFDQCDCRAAKQDCLMQGENRSLCEAIYPGC
ncbi:MAG: hypothetical protein R3257_06685 [bacterium]|nr:hypothetical protein [bacterium]